MIIVLEGESGSGKSTLAREIRRILGSEACSVVSTSGILRERCFPVGATPSRDEMLAAGIKLSESEPDWILGAWRGMEIEDFPTTLIIDAVRTEKDAEFLRQFPHGGTTEFVHIGSGEPVSWDDGSHLFELSDTYLMTGYGDPAAQALRLLERLGFSEDADCVIGAQWGSEGKGKVAAWLTESQGYYSAMGRAGGPNAGHRVELPGGGYHVFRHLPSATPYASASTALCIGPGAVVDLEVLGRELDLLDSLSIGAEVYVDPAVVVVTSSSKKMEKDHSLDGIGSTMTGTGGAMAQRVLRNGILVGKCSPHNHHYAEVLCRVNVRSVGQVLREAACRGRILLEATQGMQLSLLHGEYPCVTSRDVSPAALLMEMGLPPEFPAWWWVVARSYPIRVAGPSGNLPNETTWSEVADTSGRETSSLEQAERTSVTNRLRRVAKWTRGDLLKTCQRAMLNRNRVNVVITFADYLSQADPDALSEIIREAEACSPNPVWLGNGPGTKDMVPPPDRPRRRGRRYTL